MTAHWGRASFRGKRIPERLTLSRPDQAAIIFGRHVEKRTNRDGFRTSNVFNIGPVTAIQIHYNTSKVKQYFRRRRRAPNKDDRSTTPTTSESARILTDENWDALMNIGHDINRGIYWTMDLTHALFHLGPRCLSAVVLRYPPPPMAYPPRLETGNPEAIALLRLSVQPPAPDQSG